MTRLIKEARKLQRELREVRADADWTGPTWQSESRIDEILNRLFEIETLLCSEPTLED